MLGNQIGEMKGKRSARRVLSTNPPRVEVSFEDAGTLLGIAATGMGTYESEMQPDGTLFGQGQGITFSAEGDAVTWKGSAVGKLGAGGTVSYRGMLFFRSASAKFAALNSVGGAFEYEVDAEGNGLAKMWEWK